MVANVIAQDVDGLAGVITVVHHSVFCLLMLISIYGIIITAAIFILLLDCLGSAVVPFCEDASVVAPV